MTSAEVMPLLQRNRLPESSRFQAVFLRSDNRVGFGYGNISREQIDDYQPRQDDRRQKGKDQNDHKANAENDKVYQNDSAYKLRPGMFPDQIS